MAAIIQKNHVGKFQVPVSLRFSSVRHSGFVIRRQSGPNSKACVWSLVTELTVVASSPTPDVQNGKTTTFGLLKIIKTTTTTTTTLRFSPVAFKVELLVPPQEGATAQQIPLKGLELQSRDSKLQFVTLVLE